MLCNTYIIINAVQRALRARVHNQNGVCAQAKEAYYVSKRGLLR